MKTKNLLVFLAIITVASIAAAFKSQSSEGASLVIIRSVEKPNGTGLQKSALSVYKDGVVAEQTELDELSGKSLDGNLKIIGDLILKYKNQGYEIKSVVGAGATNSLVFTYILERK